MYVVVTGPPASGKTTLARALATELRMPLLAKDTIKAGLVESLGADTPEDSRRLGGAAVRALLAAARDNPAGAVLDSVWVDPERARADLAALPGPVVEVFCHCPRELLEERYDARGRGLDRPVEERWNEATLGPLAGSWPVTEVDTSAQVEPFAVIQRVLHTARLPEALMSGDVLGPIGPVDTRTDLFMLVQLGVRTARAVRGDDEPFTVVTDLVGVPRLVPPMNWLSGPPDWTMGWGDLEPDPLSWARDALERTEVRYRAWGFVTIEDDGAVRVQAEHRVDGSTLDAVRPPPALSDPTG